jgi:membrane protease YdiL (CAAX protease family)
MTRTRQTALFVTLALAGSYAVGAVWIAHPERGWITQFLMWSPAVAALVVQAIRREAPRAMGFRFTGVGPWLAAIAYPFAVIAACLVLAHAIELVTGAEVIHYQPDTVRRTVFGVDATGLALVPLRLAHQLTWMLPWLVVALAYRLELPERLGAGRHAARGLLWAGLFWFSPGPGWLPPGTIGEELGWRGWLVRVWRDRPIAALMIGAVVWAAFHLPVVVLVPALHSFTATSSFLLSIAAAAAAFQALYRWSGSVWPPVVAHATWNGWNTFFLGNQYGGGPSIFGGELWLINGEGLLGMLVNLAITVVLVRRWRAASRKASVGRV